MRAGSATALTHAQEYFDSTVDSDASGARLSALGNQFLLLADTVDDSAKLAEALTSTTHPVEDKKTLVDTAFGASLDPLVVDTVKELTAGSWSAPRDFAEACERLGLDLILRAAHQEHELEETQNDLFYIEQVLRNSRQLRDALVMSSRSMDSRIQLANEVFADSVSDIALLLLNRVLTRAHSGRILAGLTHMRRISAHAQGKELAEVRSAGQLSDEQMSRLDSILTQRTGKPVHIDIVEDPSVIGGLRIRVGSELFEGTLAASLQQARTRLAG